MITMGEICILSIGAQTECDNSWEKRFLFSIGVEDCFSFGICHLGANLSSQVSGIPGVCIYVLVFAFLGVAMSSWGSWYLETLLESLLVI